MVKKLIGRNSSITRWLLAAVLLLNLASFSTFAQVFPMPGWWRDYLFTRQVAPEREVTKTELLKSLQEDNVVRLSLGDATRLLLENNVDISVERYNPDAANFDILRGYVLFDPNLQATFNSNRAVTPLTSNFLTGTNSLVTLTQQYNFLWRQAFQTGTSYQVAFNNSRSSTSSLRTNFNPSVNTSLQFSFVQPLLKNRGIGVNTRSIRIAKNNQKISELQFLIRVIDSVTTVQNLYWDMIFQREDIKVKRRSLELAQKTYDDTRRQVEIGTLPPIDIIKSETEVANRRQDLIVAEYTLKLTEDQMKRLLTNYADPGQLKARIELVDLPVPPRAEDAPEADQAVNMALNRRPEILQAKKDLETRDVNYKYFRNQVLPSLDLNTSFGANGLGGNQFVRGFNPADPLVPGPIIPSSLVTGGFPESQRQLFSFNFPTYAFGLTLTIPVKNRAAEADLGRATVEKRQSEARMRSIEQAVAIQVRNAITQMEMNKARLEAATKARELAERNLDAENKKYQLGASTIRFVLEEQRNLAAAQTAEISALVLYNKAKIELARALGATLEQNHIEVKDLISGKTQTAPSHPTADQ